MKLKVMKFYDMSCNSRTATYQIIYYLDQNLLEAMDYIIDFIFLLDTNILKPKYISLNIPATVTNMLYNIITIVLAGPLRTKLSWNVLYQPEETS